MFLPSFLYGLALDDYFCLKSILLAFIQIGQKTREGSQMIMKGSPGPCEHTVPRLIPAGRNLFHHKRGSIAHSLSLSPFHIILI